MLAHPDNLFAQGLSRHQELLRVKRFSAPAVVQEEAEGKGPASRPGTPRFRRFQPSFR